MYLFLHNIDVYRHFSYFQYDLQNGAKGHVTIFFIIGSNEGFIYEQHFVKVSQQKIERFWQYSVLNPCTLNIQESLKHA